MPRLKKQDREDQILQAALDVAEQVGYQRTTREAVAARVGVSPGLISLRFGTVKNFERAIMGAAVAHARTKVIAQGLANNHPRALAAPEALRQAAVLSLNS